MEHPNIFIANVLSFTVGGKELFFSVCQGENNLSLYQSRLFPTARNLNLQIDFVGLNKFWKVSRKKKNFLRGRDVWSLSEISDEICK